MSHFPAQEANESAERSTEVFIGIPTFNRRSIVALTARSLSFADNVSFASILVIDDGSSEYDLDYLHTIYPETTRFLRNPSQSGASRVTRQLMEYFLKSNCERFLVLDSDLIVARNFMAEADRRLPEANSLLSLLHADTHPGIEKDSLLRKDSVGFAGTVWTRPLVEEVLQNVPFTIHFDRDICDYLRGKGRGIFCLRDSAVQHLGLLSGENSNFLRADFGLSFKDTSWYNLSAIQEVFLQGCRQEFQNLEQRHSAQLSEVLNAIAKLKKELKLLEMGAGLYGGSLDPFPPRKTTIRRRVTERLTRIAFALLHAAHNKKGQLPER